MSTGNAPRLQDLIQAIPGAAIVIRRDGSVVALNESFLDEFAAEDAYGETITGAKLDELAESLDGTVLEPLRRALDCERLALHGAMLWKHGAKHAERFDVVITRIDRDHSLVSFTVSTDDATELGEQRRLQRLACLGMAASGVAHDLNNHLAASMNVATLLADELGEGSPHQRALEIIVGSSQEAAGLARKLLAFAGRGQPEIQAIDLRRIVDDAALLVRHELPGDGRFQYDFAADDSELRGDATQIEHAALLLLLRTARRLDAGSMAVIRTRRIEFDQPTVSTFQRRLAAGAYICLEYVCPLDAHSEPPSSSDDLLATSDAIAFDHGGALNIDQRGSNEIISILFALTRPSANLPRAGARPESPVQLGRTILVADDDDMVRDVAAAMTRRLGFEPLRAASGREAIEIVRRADPKVDLVILDLVMGDMDGGTVLREIRSISPDVKVIVSSGYTADSSLLSGARVDATLEKPYTLAALKQTLVDVLAIP